MYACVCLYWMSWWCVYMLLVAGSNLRSVRRVALSKNNWAGSIFHVRSLTETERTPPILWFWFCPRVWMEQAGSWRKTCGCRNYCLEIDEANQYMWIHLTQTKHPPVDFIKNILELCKDEAGFKTIQTCTHTFVNLPAALFLRGLTRIPLLS